MCYFLAVGLFRPFLAIQWPFGPLIRNHLLIFWWESVLSQRFSLLINCIYCAMEAFSEEEWYNLCLLFLSLLFCSFGWCMGLCLVLVAETRRVQSENRLRSRESSKKEHWTRLQKKWMQKHLFLSSHTDHKGWQVYMKRLKNTNLAKSGVTNYGEEIGVRSQRVFKLLLCFSIVQNSFEIFQSWVLVMTTTISINTLGNFHFYLSHLLLMKPQFSLFALSLRFLRLTLFLVTIIAKFVYSRGYQMFFQMSFVC